MFKLYYEGSLLPAKSVDEFNVTGYVIVVGHDYYTVSISHASF